LLTAQAHQALLQHLTPSEYVVWDAIRYYNEAGHTLLTSSQIAKHTRLHKNTLVRLTRTLLNQEFLIFIDTSGRGRNLIKNVIATIPNSISHEFCLSSNHQKVDSTTSSGHQNVDPSEVSNHQNVDPSDSSLSLSSGKITSAIAQNTELKNPPYNPPIYKTQDQDLVLLSSSLRSEENTAALRASRGESSAGEILSGTELETSSKPAAPVKAPARRRTTKKHQVKPARELSEYEFKKLYPEQKQALITSKAPSQAHNRVRFIRFCAEHFREVYYRTKDGPNCPQLKILKAPKDRHMPYFTKAAILCVSNQVQYDAWIEFCREFYGFAKVTFPTPKMLAAQETMDRYLVRDTSKGNGKNGPATSDGIVTYDGLKNYAQEPIQLWLAAGLDLPPDEPKHLRGFVLSNSEGEIRRMPSTGTLTEPYHFHTCLLAAVKKPDGLREWAGHGNGISEQWREVVLFARQQRGTERETSWTPLLDIADELERASS
jgi:hypothetical protein